MIIHSPLFLAVTYQLQSRLCTEHSRIAARTRRAVSTLYRVRSLALQPLSAGNSAEFSQADNSKTIQPREINLTSLDSLGFRESIYIYFKPKKP